MIERSGLCHFKTLNLLFLNTILIQHVRIYMAATVDKAHSIYAGTGIQVTCEGQRHLGAVVGSDHDKFQYVSDKVNKWKKDIEQLSKIAVEEPQVALSAFTKCICHRWSFIQRTIPGIQHFFAPLEESIRNSFIPALIGKPVSDIERQYLSLPVRFGGMGIVDPSETSDREYNASKTITASLSNLIKLQVQDLTQ